MTTNRTHWFHTAGGTSTARSRMVARQTRTSGAVVTVHGAGTLEGLNDDARKQGRRLRQSPSLMVRGGRSLRGVLVMIVDPVPPSCAAMIRKHFNAGSLLTAGDRVLVELLAGGVEALRQVCGGIPLAGMLRSSGCYGIAHPQIYGMTRHLQRAVEAATDWTSKQDAIAAFCAYTESKETVRARSIHVRNRVIEHHRPDHTTYLLLTPALGSMLVPWAMNPVNRLDAVVV